MVCENSSGYEQVQYMQRKVFIGWKSWDYSVRYAKSSCCFLLFHACKPPFSIFNGELRLWGVSMALVSIFMCSSTSFWWLRFRQARSIICATAGIEKIFRFERHGGGWKNRPSSQQRPINQGRNVTLVY